MHFKVKVLAMNRYGQNLWEMEFFTNNSLSANPCEWFRKENVLHQNKSSVSTIRCVSDIDVKLVFESVDNLRMEHCSFLIVK